jgi:hypothetical protein
MKDALIFSKQHEPSKGLGTFEKITNLERALSQAQKPPSMRLPKNTSQTIKPHLQKNKFFQKHRIYKMLRGKNMILSPYHAKTPILSVITRRLLMRNLIM